MFPSRDLLQLFVTAELIKWSRLCDVYEKELRSNDTTVFPNNDEGNTRWTKLKNRVVEHVSVHIFFSPSMVFDTQTSEQYGNKDSDVGYAANQWLQHELLASSFFNEDVSISCCNH